MKDDFKGLCLFLGMLSLGYLALLMALAIFTGAKLYKGTFLIGLIAGSLITFGLNSRVKTHLVDITKSLVAR